MGCGSIWETPELPPFQLGRKWKGWEESGDLMGKMIPLLFGCQVPLHVALALTNPSTSPTPTLGPIWIHSGMLEVGEGSHLVG